jgi:energy-coupling factor transport system ATP-binding protein
VKIDGTIKDNIKENAIELNNVSYQYPNAAEACLKNINLTVKKGKFVVLMGATGAGKTTLSLCLNGLIPQLLEGKLTGQVTVCGLDVRKTPVQLMSKVLGLVLQDPETQIIGRTVEEDTAFGPSNLSVPQEEILRRVDDTLERVRLKGFKLRLTEELSGGEKQRLAIAGVLAMEPEVLVLDEPTSELDPTGRTDIYSTLDDLRTKKELTIILVEHSSEELIQKADDVVVLKEGEVIFRGEPTQLFRDIPRLQQFGIKPLPVSLIGWSFFEKGWISRDKIPLDLLSAERLMREMFSKHNHALLKLDPSRSAHITSLMVPHQIRNEVPCKDAALKINNLHYHYQSGQPALAGINLTIESGEFVALIGQNGAGKTTLAKHFNGLLKPSSGEVIVCGLNTHDYETCDLAKTVGYVFQNPDHQIFSNTVEKELEFGLKSAGFNRSESNERINQVLKNTGLERYRKVHPFTLGKGERQMIAVASILVLKPQILIVDEPTTGSDWPGVQAMMRLIHELHRSGTTIVMISHDMDLVAQYAQRVVVLKKGSILLDGSPREVFANSQVLLDAAIIPPQLCRLSSRLKELGFPGILLRPEEFTSMFESEVAEGC